MTAGLLGNAHGPRTGRTPDPEARAQEPRGALARGASGLYRRARGRDRPGAQDDRDQEIDPRRRRRPVQTLTAAAAATIARAVPRAQAAPRRPLGRSPRRPYPGRG